jgi:8-oxo-dGTP pyrophosphatase MutT (NUDIX family)
MEKNDLTQVICSGGLFLARDTKRFMLLLRTQGKTAGTWGLVGGKKEPNDVTPYDILNREIEEEVGTTPKIKKVIPLELFTSNDNNFQYNTYVLMVDREFIPTLNHEHSGYCWVPLENYPKPLHPGVWRTFKFDAVIDKIKTIEKLS